MKPTRMLRFSYRRLFLLTLVSLAVAALLGAAVSANKANRAAKVRAEQAANSKSAISPGAQNDKNPNAPAAAVIAATLTDNITAATKVAPGANISYTAVITNNGAVSPADDATNLNYSDTLDANTTLVAGSVHASPIAFNDTYNWVGNTFLDTAARTLPAVTANDVAVNAPAGTDTFTVTAIAGGATALGGTVTLASPGGAFTYTPPLGRPNIADGATAQDSFTYTITNNADPTLTSTGTVRINLTGRVWYLQAGASGDGRSNTPSSSPAAMSTAADKSTDVFYIFSNAASLNGPFSVDAGQQLLGQGVNLVVNAITLFTAAAPTPTTTNTAGSCVALAGAPGNNTVSGFNIGNCTGGTAIVGSNVGTLNVSTLSINTNGGGLDLTGVGTPTVSVVLGGLTSTGGAKNVNLVGLNGTINLAGGALSGATNNAFDVNGGAATISYTGTISNSTAKQVNVANMTGGSASFSGAIGGTGTGINLTTNTGATLNFTGGIALSTGANTAFNATGPGPAATSGGTINVTQNNTTIVNTLTSTTGTALNVVNTTISANDLTFRSVSTNGGTSGVVINNTGSSGGLIIVGNGGSCTSAATCTGGAIQNKSGGGISLTNTQQVSIDRVFIQNTGTSGVGGTQVVDFSLTNSRIDNSGTSFPANPDNDSNVGFGFQTATTENNLSGVVVITGNNLTNASEHGIDIQNFAGTISNATITNNTLTSFTSTSTPGASSHGSGIRLLGFGHAGATSNITQATIASNTIMNFPGGGGISAQYGNNSSGPAGVWGTPGSATNRIFIQNNIIQGQSAANPIGAAGILMNLTGKGQANWLVNANGTVAQPITNIAGTEIGVTVRGVNPVAQCDITNNRIVGITSANAQAIAFAADFLTATTDAPQLSGLITGNNISGQDGEAIQALATPGSSAHVDVSIKNNVTTAPNCGGCNRFGITAQVGTSSGTVTGAPSMCLDMSGNTAAGSGVNTGIGIRKRTAAYVFNIEGFVGGGDPTAFLTAANPAGGGVIMISQTTGFGNCATAPIPPPSDLGLMNMPNPPNHEMVVAGEKYWTSASQGGTTASALAAIVNEPTTVSAKNSEATSAMTRARSFAGNPSVLGKATPKASAAEVARIYRSERPISHHAVRRVFDQQPNAPTSGETVSLNTIATFPAQKSITIKYSATVNAPPLARQVSTQGTVTANGGAISVLTDDPEPAGAANPTVTLVDTLMTWNGVTSTDWNTATNWTPPAGGTQYAPGVSNPAINDVVIPNTGNQPNISVSDISIYSLNLAAARILTINAGRTLTVSGAAGSDLTLTGLIDGGALNIAGPGPHILVIGGGGTSSTNVTTVLSPAVVTANSNLLMGALAVNSGASMDITNRIMSLNGPGAALTVGGTLTTTNSTVVFNAVAPQTAAGIAYNNLTIGSAVTLTGNATVNGVLNLNSNDLNTSTFTLTQPNTTASTGTFDVVGTVSRTGGPFALATPLTFGNPNNIITFTAGTTRPTAVTVTMAKTAPATYAAAVTRNYTISQTGASNATSTLRLHYLDGELNSNVEANLNLRRFRTSDSHWVAQLPTTRDTTNNWVESNAVAAADLPTQWTFSSLAPTASGGAITGRIVDGSGRGVEGAVVLLNGTQNRKFITDANGFYRFDGVETGGFYTVTPSRVNYTFSPATRSFSQLGESTEAAFGATATGQTANPLDTPEYFVRQQYLDFLEREPDESGFNFWSDQILTCGNDQNCNDWRRQNVSAAFFYSIEFQNIGGLVDGVNRIAYGVRPNFAEFMPDTRAVGLGVRVGDDGWEAKLRANKEAFVAAFMNRPAFRAIYDGMDNSLFVETLISHTNVSFTSAERDALANGLATGTMTRAEVLQSIAENNRFVAAKLSERFVMMEYFGYLRRDPDASGFAFWLDKLNSFGGNFEQAEMVKAFIVSGEYRDRFPR